jgi:hypothetical protein
VTDFIATREKVRALWEALEVRYCRQPLIMLSHRATQCCIQSLQPLIMYTK